MISNTPWKPFIHSLRVGSLSNVGEILFMTNIHSLLPHKSPLPLLTVSVLYHEPNIPLADMS